MRRSMRYAAGVFPYVAAKHRRKWYFDTPADDASLPTSRRSA
jgi:hypothetical protein